MTWASIITPKIRCFAVGVLLWDICDLHTNTSSCFGCWQTPVCTWRSTDYWMLLNSGSKASQIWWRFSRQMCNCRAGDLHSASQCLAMSRWEDVRANKSSCMFGHVVGELFRPTSLFCLNLGSLTGNIAELSANRVRPSTHSNFVGSSSLSNVLTQPFSFWQWLGVCPPSVLTYSCKNISSVTPFAFFVFFTECCYVKSDTNYVSLWASTKYAPFFDCWLTWWLFSLFHRHSRCAYNSSRIGLQDWKVDSNYLKVLIIYS